MEGHPDASPSYTVLRSQTKEFIFRLNRYFLEEKANHATLLPVTQTRKRTADAAGISEATVKKICSHPNKMIETSPQPYKPVFTSPIKNTPKTVTNIDDFDKCVLRRTILEFYTRKDIPTLEKIKEEMKEKTGFRGSKDFYLKRWCGKKVSSLMIFKNKCFGQLMK